MRPPIKMTALDIAALVRSRERSASEVVEEHLARIAAHDSAIGAFLTVDEDGARAAAARVDDSVRQGSDPGSLAGVPVAIKDVLCTEGLRTTCASRILGDYVPPYTATAVSRLTAAGAVVIGKTNMDEFAMGSSTENSAFFPCHNPWDPDRVTGGSSGGSAAAVAAGFAPLAVGTDTGGSVRQPASLCGVVGMKPTYGRVSRYGLIAFASSLDQCGPFARTVPDAAACFRAMAGHDPADSTSIPSEVQDVMAGLDDGVAGLRIGLVREFATEGVQKEVSDALASAADSLAGAGAGVTEVSVPSALYGLPAYYVINPAECSSNLARYDGVRQGLRVPGRTYLEMSGATRDHGFGPEVKRRIMLGTYALSAGYYDAYYGKAQRVRTLLIRDFEKAYEECDVLLAPTSPTTAFRLGEKAADPLSMYLSDIFTIPSNLAGAPAISVPVGLDGQGLPIGVQVLAPVLGEAVMFRTARVLEALANFTQEPPL